MMFKKAGVLLGAFILFMLALASSPSAQASVQRVTCNCTTNAQCGTGNACCRLPNRNCGICC